MDGGSSESITDDFSDLESYWEMDSIQINGVTSNVKVEHTYKGIYRMTTRSDKVMLILTHTYPNHRTSSFALTTQLKVTMHSGSGINTSILMQVQATFDFLRLRCNHVKL